MKIDFIHLTILKRPFLLIKEEMAKVMIQQAASDRYVLITARCLSSPEVSAALKLGQNNHKKTVPRTVHNTTLD